MPISFHTSIIPRRPPPSPHPLPPKKINVCYWIFLAPNDAEAPPDGEKDQDVNSVTEKLEEQTLNDGDQVGGAGKIIKTTGH